MRGREVTDAGTVTALGSGRPSDDTSEGGSFALGDPGSPSQDGVHGWTSSMVGCQEQTMAMVGEI